MNNRLNYNAEIDDYLEFMKDKPANTIKESGMRWIR